MWMFPLGSYYVKFLPVGTSRKKETFPWSIITIAISCIAVFLFSLIGVESLELFYESYGLVPSIVAEGTGLYSLITSMFIHGGTSHLLGNMLFLWVF